MTPRTVQDALLPVPLRIGDITLQPLSMGVLLFLEKIGSPLLSAQAGQTIGALELFRGVFCLAHPLSDCLALWAEGPEAFDAAVIGFSSRLPVSSLEELATKLLDHLAAGFNPAASLQPPRPAGETEEIPLAPGTQPATASVGS
jgi:hypothetical protein